MDSSCWVMSLLESLGVLHSFKPLTLATATVVVLYWIEKFLWKQYRRMKRNRELRKAVQDNKFKREENKMRLQEEFPEKDDTLNDRETEILQMSTDILLKNLKKKDFSCVEVLLAYQKKAYTVDDALNCVTEFFLDAKDVATELDKLQDPSSLPLYGLPFCVKLNIAVKNHLQSIGLVKDLWNDLPAEDATLVAALKRLGAIPFCQTNLPQAMFSIRCKNPIFGETFNPADPTRSPGGSSGGDGALVGQGGALLALGTDVAGSVRIPAAFCGTYSFKPTAGRLSGRRISKSIKGAQGIVSSPGFQSQNVDAITTAFQALTDPAQLQLMADDVAAIPVPFNHALYNKSDKLCIGYNYGLDELIEPTPVVKRAVDETVSVLRKKGHKVIRCNYPDQAKLQKLILGFVFAEAKKQHIALLENDMMEDFLAWDLFIPTSSNFRKTVIRWYLWAKGNTRFLPYWQQRELSAGDLMMLMYERDQCIQEIRDSWVKMNVDAVVSPPLPCPAMKVEHAGRASLVGQYTCLYNMLDFPAGTLPVTKVVKEDIDKMDGFPTADLPLHKFMAMSAPGSEGLPVEVQVAAPRWKDEMVLRVMKEIETRNG